MLEEMLNAEDDWRNSTLGNMMYERFTEGMSSQEAQDWADSISSQVGAAKHWKTTDWGAMTTAMKAKVDTMAEDVGKAIEAASQRMAVTNQVKTL